MDFSGFLFQLIKAASAPSMDAGRIGVHTNPTSMIGKPWRIFVSQLLKKRDTRRRTPMNQPKIAKQGGKPKH
jgi:hypothetical protein